MNLYEAIEANLRKRELLRSKGKNAPRTLMEDAFLYALVCREERLRN
jgi:hypothetical protein